MAGIIHIDKDPSMNIETMKSKLAALEEEASDASAASFFPHPDFTPKKRVARAMELGGQAMEIVAAADDAGETEIAKQALGVAKNMKELAERAKGQTL
jgi:hypothetical protein